MITIKHITFGQRHQVAELHPEFSLQCPALTTPYLSETTQYPDDFPYAFYALEEGVVVTYINSFFDTVSKDDQHFGWAWNGNLYTHTAFRGRGLAQQIIEYQVAEFSRRGLIWGGTFSSDPALRLYRKLGFTVVGSAQRMCLMRNPAPFLAHHLKSRQPTRLFSAAYAAFYRLLGAACFRQKAFRRTYRIEDIAIEKLKIILSNYPIQYENRAHWRDDADLLADKIGARARDRISIVRDTNNKPLLFLVWRVRSVCERPIKKKYRGVRMFSIMEFGYLQVPGPASVLIEAAISLFQQSDADFLEIVTSSPSLVKAALKHGLIPLGTGMSFTFKAPEDHPFFAMQTVISDWHLTHFSGDGYSYE